MSAAAGGRAAAVSTSPGFCTRDVAIGSKSHVIEHTWRPGGEGKVLMTTALIDAKNNKRRINQKQRFVDANEAALSLEAARMADEVLKSKRDWYNRTQAKAGGSSSSSGKRRNADLELADPVITALRGIGRTRSGAATGVATSPANEVRCKKSQLSSDTARDAAKQMQGTLLCCVADPFNLRAYHVQKPFMLRSTPFLGCRSALLPMCFTATRLTAVHVVSCVHRPHNSQQFRISSTAAACADAMCIRYEFNAIFAL